MNTRPAARSPIKRESNVETVGAGLVPARRAPNRRAACAVSTRAGTSPAPTNSPRTSRVEKRLALVALLLALCSPALAQKAAADAARLKPPPAEKIVGDYLKAAGGKKRLAALGDTAYEWSVVGAGGSAGTAASHLKAPSSVSLIVKRAGDEFSAGVTTRVAWTRSADGTVRTLTDAAAKRARLRAALEASRLVDYKKRNLLAVAVGVEALADEQAYAVEFRGRDEARVRYLFGASSKMPREIRDERGRVLARFADYRAVGGVMEPHRAELHLEGAGEIKLALKSVRHDAGLAESVFDAPAGAGFDARALLKEVMEKEPGVAVKFEDYTFTVKHTERELDDKGEAKKETSQQWEIFMAPNGWSIGKLTLVNGQPLPPEKAAKEEKRVADFLTAHAEAKPPESRKGAGGFQISFGDGMGFGLADLLRACDFVSPRREKFQGREAVVFDFRPRADFKPRNRSDEILSKIVGLVWIDVAEKVVMRIEARLTGDFKIGGGLLMKIAPGAGFAFERRRLDDGYWVPRSYHWNANGKGFLVLKRSVYEITEWDNFKRFRTESGDAKLEAPKREP